MADAIPSADAALLAAQAKAGQAGVDAYQAAKQELQNQRQQAIQQAMQEAALRGAPANAIGSIQSTFTTPYDQAIASMTQGSANFQANMAARDRGMADYNASIGMARSLIPAQAEAAVAPLRAQNEYNLRSQEIAGERSIGEINANTQLEMARLQAAIEAAKRKAAADAAKAAEDARKLNDSQLTGLLDPQVADLLSSTSQSVQDMLAANQEQRRADAQRQSGLNPAEQQALSAINAATHNAALSAAYGGRGLAQAKANQFAQAAGSAFVAQQPAAGQQQAPFQTPPPAPSAYPPKPAGMSDQEWELRKPYLVPNITPAKPTAATPPAPKPTLGPAQVAAARTAALQAMATPTPAVAAQQGQYQALRQAVPAMAAQAAPFHLQQLLRPMQALNATANNYTVAGPSGNRVGITSDQLAGLDPLQRVMLLGNAGGNVVTPEDFAANVVGDPTARLTQGLTSPVPGAGSSDAVRAAYQLAAQRLVNQGGYDVTDAQLAAAMPTKVPSIFDFLAGRSEQPTATEAYAANTAAGKEIASGQTAATKQADVDADAELANRFGVTASGANIGAPSSVLAFITGTGQPETKAQFEEAVAAINSIVPTWTSDYQPDQGELTGPKLRRALQTYKNPMTGQPLTARAISLALWSQGY